MPSRRHCGVDEIAANADSQRGDAYGDPPLCRSTRECSHAQHTECKTYSLQLESELHCENGRDPEMSIHLLQTYVLPVLIYGLEVVLLKATLMKMLERIYKQFIKQILPLPVKVADPAVIYILSGESKLLSIKRHWCYLELYVDWMKTQQRSW